MQKTGLSTEEKKDPLKDLRTKFEEVKAKPTIRVVTLKYKSCCGCGCHDVKVKRTVPYDSELQDGDRITKIEKGDDF